MKRSAAVFTIALTLGAIALCALAFSQAPNARAASLVNNPSVDNTGLCLDVKGADVSSGTGVVDAFTCNGTFAQQWTIEPPEPPFLAGINDAPTIQGLKNWSSPVPFCLDVFPPVPGQPVDITFCNGTPAQLWVFDGTLITHLGFLCLTVSPLTTTLPRPVIIRECDGSLSQVWRVRS
jgi:hypothetical protein